MCRDSAHDLAFVRTNYIGRIGAKDRQVTTEPVDLRSLYDTDLLLNIDNRKKNQTLTPLIKMNFVLTSQFVHSRSRVDLYIHKRCA